MRHFAAFHFGARHFASYHLAGILLSAPTGPIFLQVERRDAFIRVADAGVTLEFVNAETAIRLRVRDVGTRLDVENPGAWTLVVGG